MAGCHDADVQRAAERGGVGSARLLRQDLVKGLSPYAHHGFEKVAEFKSDEWKTDSDDYLTYIYRKSF